MHNGRTTLQAMIRYKFSRGSLKDENGLNERRQRQFKKELPTDKVSHLKATGFKKPMPKMGPLEGDEYVPFATRSVCLTSATSKEAFWHTRKIKPHSTLSRVGKHCRNETATLKQRWHAATVSRVRIYKHRSIEKTNFLKAERAWKRNQKLQW